MLRVIGPLLVSINDIPVSVYCKICMFRDDCVINRATITTASEQVTLQRDINGATKAAFDP